MTDELYRRTIPAGAFVFREGEVGDRAYIVERGRIEIAALREGKKTVLAHLGEGELFGEMALIDEQLRSASAQALDETTLIVVDRDQVRQKLDAADPLMAMFLKVFLDRLRQTTRALAQRQQGGEEPPQPTSQGRSFAAVRQRALDILQLERELKQALELGEFEVFFQTIVATDTAHAAGFEALIRWRHPQRGLVPPGRFIDQAERSGLIVPMGAWMLRRSCAALPALEGVARDSGAARTSLFMSVNLSTRQLADPDLLPLVRTLLAESRIPPPQLKLEVTESVLMADPDQAVDVLRRLKDLGVQLAVDDFGTGYSSLSYLHRFPIDVVKIDRSFVNTMTGPAGSGGGGLKIVRSITRLAHDLELAVIAEGVELRGEFELLRELGCEYAQGYLFSKPAPLDGAEATVRALAAAPPGAPV